MEVERLPEFPFNRGLTMTTFGFAGQNVPSCTMTAQYWRITTSALFSE